MKLRKVMVIGVGNVGSTTAYTLVNRGFCEEIALVDLNKDLAYGHAQDLLDAAAYRQNMIKVSLRESTDCADIDIAIITVTSGLAQKSRAEELAGTSKIMASIVPNMMKSGFKGIFLIATNPCDAITYQVWKLSGLPRHRVIGTGAGWILFVYVDCSVSKWTLVHRVLMHLLLANMVIRNSLFGLTPQFTVSILTI